MIWDMLLEYSQNDLCFCFILSIILMLISVIMLSIAFTCTSGLLGFLPLLLCGTVGIFISAILFTIPINISIFSSPQYAIIASVSQGILLTIFAVFASFACS